MKGTCTFGGGRFEKSGEQPEVFEFVFDQKAIKMKPLTKQRLENDGQKINTSD